MIGITLTSEQIHSAPPDVRRWLEQEVAVAFNLAPHDGAPQATSKHLAACSLQEVAAIYTSIREVLPVVNVFFELAREGQKLGQDGVRVLRLADLLRASRLLNPEQLVSCLRLFDGEIRRIRQDPTAALCVTNGQGQCLIAEETQRNIAECWRQMLSGPAVAPAAEPGVSPPATWPTTETTLPCSQDAADRLGQPGFDRVTSFNGPSAADLVTLPEAS